MLSDGFSDRSPPLAQKGPVAKTGESRIITMKKAITALLLAAAATAPAVAQPGVPDDGGEVRRERAEGRGPAGWRDGGDDRRDWRDDRRADRDLRDDDRRRWRDEDRDGRRVDRQDWRRDGRGYDARGYDSRGYDGRGWTGNDRRWSGWDGRHDGWNQGWRGDRRYDWQRYRALNRRAYALPRYYAPPGFGYGYRRFGVGVRIGAPFYGPRYMISDPWAYRLPPAYGPYRWVRYFDDVLLVDIRTGMVRDVINGFFF